MTEIVTALTFTGSRALGEWHLDGVDAWLETMPEAYMHIFGAQYGFDTYAAWWVYDERPEARIHIVKPARGHCHMQPPVGERVTWERIPKRPTSQSRGLVGEAPSARATRGMQSPADSR